jgi:hypothetical protein
VGGPAEPASTDGSGAESSARADRRITTGLPWRALNNFETVTLLITIVDHISICLMAISLPKGASFILGDPKKNRVLGMGPQILLSAVVPTQTNHSLDPLTVIARRGTNVKAKLSRGGDTLGRARFAPLSLSPPFLHQPALCLSCFTLCSTQVPPPLCLVVETQQCVHS